MMKQMMLTLMLLLFVGGANANSFVLDDFAINDDDSVNAQTDKGNNYTIRGYGTNQDSDSNTISVPHDRQKGIANEELFYRNKSGVKLEGVNKDDLEDLYYGKELLRHY